MSSSKQTDLQIFKQAFEKRTQIYRYLRTRHVINPIFLYRNLSYMKDRSTFKVDGLLNKKYEQVLGQCINITFIGFFDKNLTDGKVKVGTYVTKTIQDRRKSGTKIRHEGIGTTVVKINPDDLSSHGNIRAVSVPTNKFKTSDESLHLSKKLQLNFKVLEQFTTTGESQEPLSKRSKSENKVYESERLVFDKQERCVLLDGEYEISLQEQLQTTKNSLQQLATCEVPFVAFQDSPTLKFRVRSLIDSMWSKKLHDEIHATGGLLKVVFL